VLLFSKRKKKSSAVLFIPIVKPTAAMPH